MITLLLSLLLIPSIDASSIEISYPINSISYVEQNFPSTPTWNTRNLFLGKDLIYGKGNTEIFFKGEFEQLKNMGLSSDDIKKSTINLTQYQSQTLSSTIEVELLLPTNSWEYTSLNWNNKPTIDADSRQIVTTALGRKSFDITEAFITAYTHYLQNNNDNGLAIAIPNKTVPALIFWAPGCEIAPSPPICNTGEFPSITVTLNENADILPPPEIIAEPPITGGNKNTIFWQQNTQCNEYQLQWDKYLSFTSPSQTDWIQEKEYTVTLTPATYYFRVRCRNSNKYSGWSHPTSSEQNSQYPFVEYFKSGKTIANPFLKDGAIENDFYLQGRCGGTVKKVTIIVKDKNNNDIFVQNESQKVYLWTYWPEKAESIIDGNYSVFLICEATNGDLFVAPPLPIAIDTKPPQVPTITVVTDNKRKKEVLVHCKERISGKAYLSNKIVSEFSETQKLSFELNDGSYTLKVVCTDSAGLKNENSIVLIVDTTPPSKPSVKFNDTLQPTEFISSCIVGNGIKIYLEGNLAYEGRCPEEESFIFPIDGAMLTKTYIGSQISDSYENWSDITQKVLPNQVQPNTSPSESRVTIPCNSDIDLRTSLKIDSHCQWNNLQSIFTSVNATKGEQSNILHAIEAPKDIVIDLSIVIRFCEERSFWNPLTWFGCYETTQKQTYSQLPLLIIVKNPSELLFDKYRDNKRIYSLKLDAKVTQIKIDYSLLAGKIINLNGKYIDVSINNDFSQEIQLQQVISTVKPPLGWIFSNNVSVSQWYGITAFQKPHAGIDFSVAKKEILAPDNSTVVSKGYHQPTKCFGGGHYIGLKHDTGTYSFYFHLEKTPSIAVGSRIKRGDVIAKSGNSGIYNCQALAHHLHFEIRSTQLPKDHMNPVPFIDVNWSQIPTAKSAQYPGRLTGQNPHPSY
jgi:hypothetical protein